MHSPLHSYITHASVGKASDDRREVTTYGESSTPAEDGDGDADTGDVKRLGFYLYISRCAK